MLYRVVFSCAALIGLPITSATASAIDEDQVGGWYMAFLSKDFTQSRFGVQGDIQYRTWDGGGDLE